MANVAGRAGERAAELGAVASALVEQYVPAAPQALRDEAVVRFAGYLAQSDFGAIPKESMGPRAVDLQSLAENESLQLYMTELDLAEGDEEQVTDEAAQAGYLRNLLIATSDREGFVANVCRIRGFRQRPTDRYRWNRDHGRQRACPRGVAVDAAGGRQTKGVSQQDGAGRSGLV